MKIIKSIRDLFVFICENEQEMASHVCLNDNDLPTFSENNLLYEADNLLAYARQVNNYVAAYYDCGLISRCLSLVQDRNIHGLSLEFFLSLGYSCAEANELKEVRWY